MKTQLELATDLAKHKCPLCDSALTLVQHGEHQWAVECMNSEYDDCGYMLIKDTMQEAYLAWLAEGNVPLEADA